MTAEPGDQPSREEAGERYRPAGAAAMGRGNVSLIAPIFLEISSLSHFIVFFYFFALFIEQYKKANVLIHCSEQSCKAKKVNN